MKYTRYFFNIMLVTIVIVIIWITQTILSMVWWGFAVPVWLLGALISYNKWKIHTFSIGFVAGFLTWSVSNLYFELNYNSEGLHTIASVYRFSFAILLLIAGLIGGLLTGLALYTGEKTISYIYPRRKKSDMVKADVLITNVINNEK